MSEYDKAIQALASSAKTTRQQLDHVVELGRQAGKSDEEIHADIKKAFSSLPKTSYYRSFPEEFKRTYWKVEKTTTSSKVEHVTKPVLPAPKVVEIRQEAPKIEYTTAEELQKATKQESSEAQKYDDFVMGESEIDIWMDKKFLGAMRALITNYSSSPKPFKIRMKLKGRDITEVFKLPVFEMEIRV